MSGLLRNNKTGNSYITIKIKYCIITYIYSIILLILVYRPIQPSKKPTNKPAISSTEDNLASNNVSSIELFLNEINLQKYVDKFIEQNIDINILVCIIY